MDLDPDRLRLILWRIHVHAPLPKVKAALSTAEGIMGWMSMEASLADPAGEELPPGQPASPGDRLLLRWHTGHEETAVYIEARSGELLRYRAGEGAEVAFRLEELEDSVLVELEQRNLLSDEENLAMVLGYSPGWAFYLANLKSVLEGGLDLRDHAHDTEGLINF